MYILPIVLQFFYYYICKSLLFKFVLCDTIVSLFNEELFMMKVGAN